MKIGDKVRFLSETGGGRVSGFKGNNIVLVQDEDGFEIPTPINEVVVVTNEDYSSTHQVSVSSQKSDSSTQQSVKQQLSASASDDLVEEEDEEVDDPLFTSYPNPKSVLEATSCLCAWLLCLWMSAISRTPPSRPIWLTTPII